MILRAALLILGFQSTPDVLESRFSAVASAELPKIQFSVESSTRVELRAADRPSAYSLGLGVSLPKRSKAKASLLVEKMTMLPAVGGWNKPISAVRFSGLLHSGISSNGLLISLFAKSASTAPFKVFKWHETDVPPRTSHELMECANGYLESIGSFDAKQAKSASAYFLTHLVLEKSSDSAVFVIVPEAFLPKEDRKPVVSVAAQTDRGPVTFRRDPRPEGFPRFQSNDYFWKEAGRTVFYEHAAQAMRTVFVSNEGELTVEHRSYEGSARRFKMPVFHGFVSSVIRSSRGDYYYFTFSKEVEPLASIVRTDSEGALLARVNLDTSEQQFDLLSLGGSTSSLAVNERSLFLISSRGMHSRHQGAFAAVFDASTLALRKYFGQTASHSFANRALNDRGVFASLDLADNFPRGIRITKYSESDKVARTIFTYKTKHNTGTKAGLDDGKPRTPGQWSNDNNTYSQLGGFLSTPNGYLVAFAAEQSTDNAKARTSNNESRNVGVALVRKDFQNIPQTETIIPPKLLYTQGPVSPMFGFYDYVGRYERQQNRDIAWLTQYANLEKETARSVRAVELGESQYLVLWEEWETKGFKEVKAIVIDEFGNIQSQVMSLGSKIRISNDSWPQWLGSYLVWSYETKDSINTVAWKAAKF